MDPKDKPPIDPLLAGMAKTLDLALDGIQPKIEPVEEKKEDKPPDEKKEDKKSEPTLALAKEVDAIRAPAPKEKPAPEPAPADWVKALTPEQMEEYELAVYAEAHGTPGQVENLRTFYTKVDDFRTKNPDTTPDSEDFLKFVETEQPKYPNRRKLERQMIADQAAAAAMKRVEPELEESRRKQRELEVAPRLQRSVAQFEDMMVDPEFTVPDGVSKVITKQVIEAVRANYEDALKKYPVEAPIAAGHINAAQELLRISAGVVVMNGKNPIHTWLHDFTSRQESLARGRKDTAGREFATSEEYVKHAEAGNASKYWTFSDMDLLNLIAMNAHVGAHSKAAQLQDGGWTRAAEKQTATPEKKEAPKSSSEESPKAGATIAPGAADRGKVATPNADFLNRLMPGAADRLSA